MIMLIGIIQAKQGLGCWQVQLVWYCKELIGLGAWGGAATGKIFNLYPHLCLETVFPTLKWYKIVA